MPISIDTSYSIALQGAVANIEAASTNLNQMRGTGYVEGIQRAEQNLSDSLFVALHIPNVREADQTTLNEWVSARLFEAIPAQAKAEPAPTQSKVEQYANKDEAQLEALVEFYMFAHDNQDHVKMGKARDAINQYPRNLAVKYNEIIRERVSCIPSAPIRQSQTTPLKQMEALPPVGIRNNSGSDCWANCILQMCLNSTSLAKRFIGGFASFQQAYLTAQQGSSQPINSTGFRDQLIKHQKTQKVKQDPTIPTGIPTDSVSTPCSPVGLVVQDLIPGRGQIDMNDGFKVFLESIGVTNPCVQDIYKVENETETTFIQTSSKKGQPIQYPTPTIRIDIAQRIPFSYLVDRSFVSRTDQDYILNNRTGERGVVEKRLRFETAPDDLIICATRFKQDYRGRTVKINTDISGVPDELNRGDNRYAFKGCGIHLGETANNGHYISIIKKPDGYYLMNDSLKLKWTEQGWYNCNAGRLLTLQEHLGFQLIKTESRGFYSADRRRRFATVDISNPKDLMKQGYMFLYSKVDQEEARPPRRQTASAASTARCAPVAQKRLRHTPSPADRY